MTLDELRTQLAQLSELSGDTVVVLAKDAEGNGFSPLVELEPALYLAESTYSGEHYMTEAQRQATGDPEEYFRAPDGAVPALFLWPTN